MIYLQLADRLEQSEIDYMTDRMEAVRQREGNPEGVEIRSFGGAVAFYSSRMPWPQFNCVKGISETDLPYLDEIVEFYADRDRSRYEIQITPAKASPKLFQELADRGLYQSGFHTTLYGRPGDRRLDIDEGWTVRELEMDEFGLYGKIHCIGSGLPAEGAPYVAANNQVLYRRPGWRFFVASCRSEPAAVGVMYMREGTASLTFAATLPEYRRKGLQSRLLELRIQEAYMCGCDLVVGQAAYASSSHRNMERAGMRVGYNRSTWVSRGSSR